MRVGLEWTYQLWFYVSCFSHTRISLGPANSTMPCQTDHCRQRSFHISWAMMMFSIDILSSLALIWAPRTYACRFLSMDSSWLRIGKWTRYLPTCISRVFRTSHSKIISTRIYYAVSPQFSKSLKCCCCDWTTRSEWRLTHEPQFCLHSRSRS